MHFLTILDSAGTKKNYIFEKSNNFNSLDIYAVIMYFIVHFNA